MKTSREESPWLQTAEILKHKAAFQVIIEHCLFHATLIAHYRAYRSTLLYTTTANAMHDNPLPGAHT